MLYRKVSNLFDFYGSLSHQRDVNSKWNLFVSLHSRNVNQWIGLTKFAKCLFLLYCNLLKTCLSESQACGSCPIDFPVPGHLWSHRLYPGSYIPIYERGTTSLAVAASLWPPPWHFITFLVCLHIHAHKHYCRTLDCVLEMQHVKIFNSLETS